MSKTEIPWSLRAFHTYARSTTADNSVPYYALTELEDHQPVPEFPTYWDKTDDRWRTVEDIRNLELMRHMEKYAKEHGHQIPAEVMNAWGRESLRQALSREVTEIIGDELEASRKADTFEQRRILHRIAYRIEHFDGVLR